MNVANRYLSKEVEQEEQNKSNKKSETTGQTRGAK
jgi:hypothetical protein